MKAKPLTDVKCQAGRSKLLQKAIKAFTFACTYRKIAETHCMSLQLSQLRIEVSDRVFLKDPLSSVLGKDILVQGIRMIDAHGMEGFSFRKLAAEIGTTESAVYRYFENKHRMLLYYVEWYWAWLDYQIAFATANVEDGSVALERAIGIVTSQAAKEEATFFDLCMLQRVVVAESSKSYLTKVVDEENKEGLFARHKSLCRRIAELMQRVNPDYPFSHSLASTLIGSHLEQVYFAQHLPSLSEVGGSVELRQNFFQSLIFNVLRQWPK